MHLNADLLVDKSERMLCRAVALHMQCRLSTVSGWYRSLFSGLDDLASVGSKSRVGIAGV